MCKHKELIKQAAKKAFNYGISSQSKTKYGYSMVEIQKIKRTYDYAVNDKIKFDFIDIQWWSPWLHRQKFGPDRDKSDGDKVHEKILIPDRGGDKGGQRKVV